MNQLGGGGGNATSGFSKLWQSPGNIVLPQDGLLRLACSAGCPSSLALAAKSLFLFPAPLRTSDLTLKLSPVV